MSLIEISYMTEHVQVFGYAHLPHLVVQSIHFINEKNILSMIDLIIVVF